MAKLHQMQYGSFTWKNNPATCTYSCDRSYARYKYPELFGVELEDMDADAAVITGEGEFFGIKAYSDWKELVQIFNTHGVQTFKHPIFTDIQFALMTKLSAKLEPRENYVSYSFEIVQHVSTVWLKNNLGKKVDATIAILDNASTADPVIGDVVICNGSAYSTSYGNDPSTILAGNKLTVTKTNYSDPYPVHVGSIGWMATNKVKKSEMSKTTTADIIYVVKTGDTLSKICARYNVDWKIVAKYNNLKNPNLIYPGQKIKIQQ